MRRSDRVEIQIPIQINGHDPTTGTAFLRDCESSIVSRDGVTVALNRILSVNQEVTVRCLGTNKEAKARVIGLIQRPGTQLVYGLAFLETETDFWGIEFPVLGDSDDGLVRLLLGCEGCGRSEVVHLNEIEVEVFATTHSLRRSCPSCHAVRHWRENSTATAAPLREAPLAQPSISVSNRRRDRRVKTTMSACIRRPPFKEEVVACDDVSRGGIRFRTRNEYRLNDTIEVAVPYSAGSGNIYVLARVIRVLLEGGSFVVAVSFTPNSMIKPLGDA